MEANSIGVGPSDNNNHNNNVGRSSDCSSNKSRKLVKSSSSHSKRKNKKCISCQGPRNDLQETSDAQQKRCSALFEKIAVLQLDILSSHLVRQYDSYLEKVESHISNCVDDSSKDVSLPSTSSTTPTTISTPASTLSSLSSSSTILPTATITTVATAAASTTSLVTTTATTTLSAACSNNSGGAETSTTSTSATPSQGAQLSHPASSSVFPAEVGDDKDITKMCWRDGSSTSDLNVIHKIIEKIELGSGVGGSLVNKRNSSSIKAEENQIEKNCKKEPAEDVSIIAAATTERKDENESVSQPLELSTTVPVKPVEPGDSSSVEGLNNSLGDSGQASLNPKALEFYNEKLADETHWLSENMNRVARETMQLSTQWDETDSSCGDESCDEEIAPKYNESETLKLPYLPFAKNPSASWALARAAAITSWLWNHDAIAHVSFRLEQQDQVHRHLKTTKPTFQLEDKPQPGVLNPNIGMGTSLLQNAYIQVYTPHVPADSMKSPKPSYPNGQRVTESPLWSEPRAVKPNVLKDQIVLGTSYPFKAESDKIHSTEKKPYGINKNHTHPVNCDRLKNIGGGLESLGIKVRQESDVTCTARRCLPLKPYRPRKIFQLGGVHKMGFQPSKKPTIICECFGKKELCASCTGRLDKVRTVDGEFDDFKDLAGILDDSHHHSLAIIEEKPLTLAVEASLAAENYEKVTNAVTDLIGIPLTEAELKEAEAKERIEIIKRKRSRPKPEFVNTKPTPPSSHTATTNTRESKSKYKRKKLNSVSSDAWEDSNNSELSDYDDEYSYLYDTDAPSPGYKYSKRGSSGGQDGYRRKRDEKYDIDNIVIPYSIASTTRVEKIEYKEIITPSWRLNPNGYGKASGKNGICSNGWDDTEIEDLSTEVIQARHERSEAEEHRKFNLNPKKSHRRSRRVDSKADYSESNSPDPMSPNPEGHDSNPLGSPGSRSPLVHIEKPETSMLIPPSPNTMHAPVVTEAVAALAVSALKMNSLGPGRRRTMSSTNSAISIDEDDDRRTSVMPWEKRTFPLSEDEYTRMRTEMPEEYLKLCDEDELCWKDIQS